MTDRADLGRALAKQGYLDVLVTNRETAKRLLTDEVQDLLHLLAKGRTKTVQDLAAELCRDVTEVNRDIDDLFKEDVIEYEEDSHRSALRLKHRLVIAEPLISQED